MTIKESYQVAGSPSTWGAPALKDNIGDATAVAAQRMIDAGVTLFGKTNLPLMLADWQSYNAVYGVTRNPWDLDRTPGGSSGGSSAALSAGLTGIDAGSDISSSIRNPACSATSRPTASSRRAAMRLVDRLAKAGAKVKEAAPDIDTGAPQ